MSRHPARRRPHNAPASDDDRFVHSVLRGSAWARENARTLIVAGAVIVALVIGFLVYRNYSNAREIGAANALNDLRTTVASGNVPLALRDGEALVSRYNGTEAANEARVMLGYLYLQASHPQQPGDVLGLVVRAVNSPLRFIAAMMMAAAYEAAGQKD